MYQIAELHKKCGDLEQAIESATRLVATEPLHQEGHIILMHLFLQAGQPEQAFVQFQWMETQWHLAAFATLPDEALSLRDAATHILANRTLVPNAL